MDVPVVLTFHLKLSPNVEVIRSITLRDYFAKLTPNVEVLYPTQVNCGLLLCKSKRTEEKILNMHHVLPNGSEIHLNRLARSLFHQTKCVIHGQTMQTTNISKSFQQCLPFLTASDGKYQVNPDASVVLEGHISILNSIHSFLMGKVHLQEQPNNAELLESLNFSVKNFSMKVISGKLFEQSIDHMIIPMSEKYKIHKAFEQQIRSLGGTAIINSVKELKAKATRGRPGDIFILPNQELKISAKHLIFFIVPYLPNNDDPKDKSMINSFQAAYEQIIGHALQTIEQNGITSFAMTILEPILKYPSGRDSASKMAIHAWLGAIHRHTQNPSIKLRRILIVDHQAQINRISKRVHKYQNQMIATKPTTNKVSSNDDDTQSFTYLFGVPKLPGLTASTSESDADNEPEE